MRDVRTLNVWRKAHELALAVYAASKPFPREELFGLTSQMRRAAASIPTNIAEGCGRDGSAELARFCRIAMGSASELEYQLLLARDLNLLPSSTHTQLTNQVSEVKRMLMSFVDKLATDGQKTTTDSPRKMNASQKLTADS